MPRINFLAGPLLVMFVCLAVQAQPPNYGKGLKIEDAKAYHKDITANPANRLVEILPAKTGIRLDIRYATFNNFMHRPMYSQARAFARAPVYHALLQVQKELQIQGLGLKVFDAYRPYSVTVKFYEMAKDTNFVADPRKGSRHNLGCAVDLTLVDLKTGNELEMPTGYDSFLPAAAANYNKASPVATANRQLLQNIMIGHGFTTLATEWWHFDYADRLKFELLNIPFSEL